MGVGRGIGWWGWVGWVQMLTSVYDNANPDANMYIVISIAQLSLSAVLKPCNKQ